MMNMDKYFTWIHYERLHNHNKAKHNKTVCIFLGIYCRSISWLLMHWLLLSCDELCNQKQNSTFEKYTFKCITNATSNVKLRSGCCYLNTLKPRQYGRHFPNDIFKRIFLNEEVKILFRISMTFVPRCPINNIPALIQIMAWRRIGDKPLSEPMTVSLLTHICVTRPERVKFISHEISLSQNSFFSYHCCTLCTFSTICQLKCLLWINAISRKFSLNGVRMDIPHIAQPAGGAVAKIRSLQLRNVRLCLMKIHHI